RNPVPEGRGEAATPHEPRAVPPGRHSIAPLDPALKCWAIVARPSGTQTPSTEVLGYSRTVPPGRKTGAPGGRGVRLLPPSGSLLRRGDVRQLQRLARFDGEVPFDELLLPLPLPVAVGRARDQGRERDPP